MVQLALWVLAQWVLGMVEREPTKKFSRADPGAFKLGKLSFFCPFL
jgi:hypothetical protein